MTIGTRIMALLFVGASFLLGLVLTFLVLDGVAVRMLHFDSLWVGLSGFAAVVASVACGFVFARFVPRACFKRWNGPASLIPKSRWVVVPLLAAYLLTWAVGVPAVQSANTSWAIDHSIGIVMDPQVGRLHYPYVRTYVAFPLLPFVVASLHENQTASLAGWGGWDFQLWYGLGTCRLFRLTHFVS